MSVIVKDMNMPKSCAVCEYSVALTNNDYLCNRLFSTGNINLYVNDGLKRPDCCPLVALPENHGRLIDADSLRENIESFGGILPEEINTFLMILKQEKTIIESEEV